MVQSPHIDAAARVALRLVLQRKTQVLGRLVPLRLGVEFDEMAMGIVKPVGGPMPKLLLDPAEIRGLDRLHAPQQGPRAAAKSPAGRRLNVRALAAARAEGSYRPVETGAPRKSKDVIAPAGTEYFAYLDGTQTVSITK